MAGLQLKNNKNKAANESGKGLSKMLVLTKNDLERIAGHLNRRQNEEDAYLEEKMRKKELHEKSQALTKNWNNTIQGARRYKLEQKKIRDDKIEEKRRAVDLEHAEYLAEERRKAIEQAKLLQYHETDRIKTFHSAMKLSEVLKERDAQLEMKKVMAQLNRDMEYELDQRNMEILNEKYKDDDSLCIKKAGEITMVTEFLKRQMSERKRQERLGLEEKKRDAEEIRLLQERIQFENEQLEQLRLQKVRNLKETYKKAMENKKKIKEAEACMDEEENEDIRIYADAKKKMAIMKREREDEANRNKEEHRDAMMAYLGSLLKMQVEDEEFRIAKAVEKQEAKRAKEENDKEAKFRNELEEINKHRIDTIQRKEADKQAKQREEDELMKMKVEADLKYQVFESEKGLKIRQKLKEQSQANSKLINERKDLDKRVRFADKEFVQRELELMNLEDKQFEDYASRVIDYMKQHGRNTFPMERILNEVVKPTEALEKSQASHIKKHQNDVPTKKNLGFS